MAGPPGEWVKALEGIPLHVAGMLTEHAALTEASMVLHDLVPPGQHAAVRAEVGRRWRETPMSPLDAMRSVADDLRAGRWPK